MSIVNEKKSELNERQLEAVNTVKGPVVIIAGPGTGKTKTLVERTVNILVNEKVEAKKVVKFKVGKPLADKVAEQKVAKKATKKK